MSKINFYARLTLVVQKLIVPILLLPILLMQGQFSNQAYAAFDLDGNYYCNQGNLPLEETIFKSALDALDAEAKSYKSLNPGASAQELKNHIATTSTGTSQSTLYVMNQAKSCLEENGIDTASIVNSNNYILSIGSGPEFGTIVQFVIFAAVMGVVILQRGFQIKPKLN